MYDIYESIRRLFVPIHKEGYPFILIGVVLMVLGFLWAEPLGWILADPHDVGLLLLPRSRAGHARCATGSWSPRPTAACRRSRPPCRRRSSTCRPSPCSGSPIFMNVFDCHVNRAPVDGPDRPVVYTPGLFLNAELDKASEDNERSAVVIETGGAAVGVVQIAGLVARRIVSFVREGDAVGAGERFGLIRFGSRVDVYLPMTARVLVGAGQLSIAGETVLADLNGDEPPRQFRAG